MVLDNRTPLLLLRGLAREQRHWGEFRPLLADTLPNPILSFDYAGSGQLYQQSSPCSISALRQSVRSQLQQALEFNGKVHLVALSLGAMLAADWAASFPQEVASITLINSSARPLSPFYQRLRWQSYPALMRGIFADTAKREQVILQLTSARPAEHVTAVANWQLWQQQRPVSRLNTLRQLWAAKRFRVPAAPQCPTLLLSSLADRLVSPTCSARLADYWQVKHLQHPWAGHDLPLDDANWTVTQIAAFIRQV
ncbi:alpha/beta fold hydrolase [Rheinheimera maricola]|uniref:Alpha/beta hydrolase n=1 Tax=Rheinheimera maricola TaxID=2793282 RepID=A0ABS7X3J3_9GAMM|nr:alpha/beta hydrolase [Rheinheimera maricola]MBZ9610134.1 alpha/beta hydrolase [Rheinheimera maricola]